MNKWPMIIDFQDKFYPGWMENLPRLLYSNALAGEVGELCGVITHLDGGGTNNNKYTDYMILEEAVDTYIQLVLLLARSGFEQIDFEVAYRAKFEKLRDRLESRLSQQLGTAESKEVRSVKK